jgi:2'-5' RNA ligase
MRTFVAIDLDPELKKALQDLVLKLKKTGADVRWVNFHGMHLTLKFLGEVEQDSVPAVENVLRTAASGHARFPFVLEGTGTFPEGKSPRVLWVGVRKEPVLLDLQFEIEAGLEKEGYPSEERAFHPHLTLGRVKSSLRVREAVAELAKYREAPLGEMTARKVTLFQSILKPEGAEYRVVSEYELR